MRASDQPPTAPAAFPLPGGQPDAQLTLHPLLCAEISAPPRYSKTQLDPRPRYRTVDFTAPPSVASGPFERTIDVFGDGTLTLASTPGHTAGHISLVARLDGREALLAADAAYTMGTIRGDERPWLIHDRKAFEHSLRQIQAYDREHSEAVVIPGHEMAAWEEACARLDGR